MLSVLNAFPGGEWVSKLVSECVCGWVGRGDKKRKSKTKNSRNGSLSSPLLWPRAALERRRLQQFCYTVGVYYIVVYYINVIAVRVAYFEQNTRTRPVQQYPPCTMEGWAAWLCEAVVLRAADDTDAQMAHLIFPECRYLVTEGVALLYVQVRY